MINKAASCTLVTPGWASLVLSEASASHAPVTARSQLTDAQGARSAADALHSLCTVHGRHPGVIDHAAALIRIDVIAHERLIEVAHAFAGEREYLAHLVVAAGPRPSTPGQAETMAAVLAQRHAVDMLVRSERDGVATGAALALALDWRAIRPVLDAAAARFGVDAVASTLPPVDALVELAEALCPLPAAQRAFLFGAQQIAAQHRGLWTLLQARAAARSAN